MNENNSQPDRRQALAAMAAGAATLGAAGLTAPASAQESAAAGRLAGKVAFVTGAARGIGRASAVAMAREGADVVLFDIAAPVPSIPYPMATRDDLAETERQVRAQGRRCLAVRGDVRDLPALRAAVGRAERDLGGVDIVFANAGVFVGAPLATMTDEQWSTQIDTMLTGTANTFRAAIPQMIKRGRGGRLIATSSEAGRRGMATQSPYTAAKWGIIGLVKVASQELSSHMITANAICPGSVRTGMTQNGYLRGMFGLGENPSQAAVDEQMIRTSRQANKLPIAWIEPEDIASAVLFLASEQGRYVTGTALDVTAGTSTQWSA